MARPHRIMVAEARAIRWAKHHAEPERWFWQRVDRREPDECWPWTGRVVAQRRGYGRLTFRGRSIGAHRMALILTTGENPPGKFACHRCDNPVCCNPAHLWWGTGKQNSEDAVQKGRMRGQPRRFDRARLVELRGLGRSYTQIATELGVGISSVGRALKKFGLAGQIRPNQTALRARASSAPSDTLRTEGERS